MSSTQPVSDSKILFSAHFCKRLALSKTTYSSEMRLASLDLLFIPPMCRLSAQAQRFECLFALSSVSTFIILTGFIKNIIITT